eukprot:gnl/MRDRNA2_/MRDRNA2_96552_c0_seq1.p1 gnl/MRDRNA2_/MRDRNA2_96552_c0~~gnl/MRDRNA2_/MRDRNA2_96552_c0_seq1.p1  ORF type:complete len:119 (-),score=36.70 gnl/MRDRNA2_/MRDRNA2_96552_c0_seq1:122-478(-)
MHEALRADPGEHESTNQNNGSQEKDEKSEEEEEDHEEGDVAQWLAERGLKKYIKKFVKEGYDDLRILHDMTAEEEEGLIASAEMKKGHANHFRRALHQLREVAPEPSHAENLDEPWCC